MIRPMFSPHNPNCDGGHCRFVKGPVKLYPLGGGANLILCRACWEHENRYRQMRGRETGARDTGGPEKWPLLDWVKAEPYGDCVCGHTWDRHKRTGNGAFSCTHHGCGCHDVVVP